MKTYFAVGNKQFTVPVIIHDTPYGRCNLFTACPAMHADEIKEQDKINNFDSCSTFKLFDTEEAAVDFILVEKYHHNVKDPNTFLIFKIKADEKNLPQSTYINELRSYIAIDRSKISSLDESSVSEITVFNNTEPKFLEPVECNIF